MTLLRVGACALLFCFGLPTFANSAKGEIESVMNAYLGTDSFIVTLKPGWVGTGCSGNTNGSNPITYIFSPGSNSNTDVYHRNFALALAAKTSGQTITMFSYGSSCDGFAFRIDDF